MADLPGPDDIEAAQRLAEQLVNGAISDTEVAFVGMHEMFTEMQQSGFTEYQALWLVGYIMCDGPGKQS